MIFSQSAAVFPYEVIQMWLFLQFNWLNAFIHLLLSVEQFNFCDVKRKQLKIIITIISHGLKFSNIKPNLMVLQVSMRKQRFRNICQNLKTNSEVSSNYSLHHMWKFPGSVLSPSFPYSRGSRHLVYALLLTLCDFFCCLSSDTNKPRR